jgi:cytoskeletal protein RodZ
MAAFGEKLRREREMRGVSLREVADGTKISLRFLQAIEEDRVEVLPGGLFPRAFVRQYAAFLGLDGERLAADFAAAHGFGPAQERRVLPGRHAPVGETRRVTPVQVLLGVFALVAVGFVLRKAGGSAERPPRGPESAKPIVAAPAVLPTDRVYPPPSQRPSSPPGREGLGLAITLTAQRDCWVEVRADGETRVNRVLPQGETLRFEARGEIILSVGDAGGLQLRLNDRLALPLGRNGEVRKNIVINRQNLPSLLEQAPAASSDGSRG